MRTLDTMTF